MADPRGMPLETFDRAYALMSGVFAEVRGQVAFAETKNGALFASTMAIVVGIVAILAGSASLPENLVWCFGAMCVGLSGAGFAALISFLPIMGPKRHRYSRGRDDQGENLIYWGEIQRYTATSYTESFLNALDIREPAPRLLLDLAEQVVINSGIASRKFKLFWVAAWITAFALALPAVALLLHLANNGLLVS